MGSQIMIAPLSQLLSVTKQWNSANVEGKTTQGQ